jgi:hypothetical protein
MSVTVAPLCTDAAVALIRLLCDFAKKPVLDDQIHRRNVQLWKRTYVHGKERGKDTAYIGSKYRARFNLHGMAIYGTLAAASG